MTLKPGHRSVIKKIRKNVSEGVYLFGEEISFCDGLNILPGRKFAFDRAIVKAKFKGAKNYVDATFYQQIFTCFDSIVVGACDEKSRARAFYIMRDTENAAEIKAIFELAELFCLTNFSHDSAGLTTRDKNGRCDYSQIRGYSGTNAVWDMIRKYKQ